MKKGIHPEYREVVFSDAIANFSFLTRSTVATTETIQWSDGKTYPLYKLDISSASHPFFTGKMKFIDTTGRVEKFTKKYAKGYGAAPKKDAAPAKPDGTAS
ncbi:MAG: type B 50S ribosomal protein L31 [Gemmataceae bacterium]